MDIAARLIRFEHDIVFLRQGAMPKHLLIEKFKQLPRCVLLATRSFWEGVDVRGADLRCLIIDKLPFANPENPMVQAQLESINAGGGNGFSQYSLPEAAISLKQGFGRLIRSRDDHGAVLILDDRIVRKRYGRFLRESLPDVPFVKGAWDDVERALRSFYEGRPTR